MTGTRSARRRHRRLDGDADLRGLAHRLDDEPVDPCLHERARLDAERPLHLRQILRARLAEEVTARSDRAEHVRAPLRRAPRDRHARLADLLDAIFEPVLLEAQRVRAERVRLDDLRAGAEVVLVDLGHELRAREVQLFEARAVEHASLVELRPHRAVYDERTGSRMASSSGRSGLYGGHRGDSGVSYGLNRASASRRWSTSSGGTPPQLRAKVSDRLSRAFSAWLSSALALPSTWRAPTFTGPDPRRAGAERALMRVGSSRRRRLAQAWRRSLRRPPSFLASASGATPSTPAAAPHDVPVAERERAPHVLALEVSPRDRERRDLLAPVEPTVRQLDRGGCSRSISLPCERASACSIARASSRTFPGKSYASRAPPCARGDSGGARSPRGSGARGSGARGAGDPICARGASGRRDRPSSARSRGPARKRPASTFAWRSWCVAAMRRAESRDPIAAERSVVRRSAWNALGTLTHLGDLVQEERPVLRRDELPVRREEILLDRRPAGAVHGDEGARGAATARVESPRDDLLPGAGLARAVMRTPASLGATPVELPEEPPHRRRVADQRGAHDPPHQPRASLVEGGLQRATLGDAPDGGRGGGTSTLIGFATKSAAPSLSSATASS